ncbi:hypothetical protein [Methylocystis echinoides]|uniref:Uncharacterized protein n=1 Tax=Methylocystis echinoides TaxID=29468 RepID=A0A9W6GQL9_9HYPH|nr:hypothetical protein [Methylocystis echinoides]GLI91105.1 hypothetical protein LMG27198_00970 [Methylocystis echinoides]
MLKVLFVAAALFLGHIPTGAQCTEESDKQRFRIAPRDVIVSVKGVDITEKDLEDAVNDRLPDRSYELNDDHEIRRLVLKNMILRILASRLMSPEEIAKDPALMRKLESSRQEILLQSYLDKKVKITPPTELDIDKFVSAHPHHFLGRKNYHYGELIIEAKTPATLRATKDRLKLLAELGSPSLEAVQMVDQWLIQNHIRHGYLRTWRVSEDLSDSIKNVLSDLENSGKKISIEERGSIFRVVVLFDAHPDPLDPIFAKKLVFGKLLREARQNAAAPVVSDMLARGGIVLYDQSFKDLDVPKAIGAKEAHEQHPSIFGRLIVAWNSTLLIFVPAALWLFYRKKQPNVEYGIPSPLVTFSYSPLFRIAFVTAVGALALTYVALSLLGSYTIQSKIPFVSATLLGIISALSICLLIGRIPLLRDKFSSRWDAITAIAVLEVAILTGSDLLGLS